MSQKKRTTDYFSVRPASQGCYSNYDKQHNKIYMTQMLQEMENLHKLENYYKELYGKSTIEKSQYMKFKDKDSHNRLN